MLRTSNDADREQDFSASFRPSKAYMLVFLGRCPVTRCTTVSRRTVQEIDLLRLPNVAYVVRLLSTGDRAQIALPSRDHCNVALFALAFRTKLGVGPAYVKLSYAYNHKTDLYREISPLGQREYGSKEDYTV